MVNKKYIINYYYNILNYIKYINLGVLVWILEEYKVFYQTPMIINLQ